MSDVQEKREANMRAREDARRQRNNRIAAEKAKKVRERLEASKQAQAQAEAQEMQKSRIASRRVENIARRETIREQHGDVVAGYCKEDIVCLKVEFDDVDRAISGDEDLHGSVDAGAFIAHIQAKHKSEDRDVISVIERFGEAAFDRLMSAAAQQQVDVHVVDDTHDAITFQELLERLCRGAVRPVHIETMLSWVELQAVTPTTDVGLQEETQGTMAAIFRLYEEQLLTKGADGHTSVDGLQLMTNGLAKTGLEPEELQRLFKEFDLNGNGVPDLDEERP